MIGWHETNPIHRQRRSRCSATKALGPLASAGRCGCSSENIPLSDREPVESFHHTIMAAVMIFTTAGIRRPTAATKLRNRQVSTNPAFEC